jgi:small-conductance mechanosensitive channel
MFWLSIATTAFYFGYSLIGDALDFYNSIRIPELIRSISSRSLGDAESFLENYSSSIRNSLRNAVFSPFFFYTIPIETILPVNLRLVRLVINLLLGGFFYLVWQGVVEKNKYKYRIDVGGGNVSTFLLVLSIVRIPLYVFPLCEWLIGVYSILATIFLIKKNLDRGQDERRTPIQKTRPFYTLRGSVSA